MSENKGNKFDLRLFRRILQYVKPYKDRFITALVITILISVFATSRPLLIQYTIDEFINPKPPASPDAHMLLVFTLIMIGLLLIESVLQYFSIYLTNWLGQYIILDMRDQLYRHILSFRLKYFDRNPIGTLVTRVISDMQTIANIFSEGIVVIFGDLFKLLVVLITMFVFNWRLSLISLLVFPFLLFASVIFQRAIKSAFQEVRKEVANLNAFVQEHLTGMKVVQIFNREDSEYEKFQEINQRHMKANIRSIWHFSIFLPVVEISAAVSMGLLIWWGGIESALGTRVSLGDLVAFILFVNMLFRPIRQLADRFNTLQMGMVASERVFRVLDTDSFVTDNGSYVPEKIKGDIAFEEVEFSYVEDDPVLKGISFELRAGQKMALVGATGAGKTSIINLIGKFYEIQKGRILVDGVSIDDYELAELRKRMAVVLQDVFLFSDSIMNNITLEDPNVSAEEVIEAAKIIGVHDFIMSLPGGYEFNVRERGGMLSAGQRQLIAFLRAYVSRPDLLILDEATSSVDSHTEQLMQHAEEKLTEGRTSIIIAHRLSTIQKADLILVMDKGRIVERGTHQELLSHNGYYKELYEIQFEEDSV
jgi:subfamily B ATP-binding cassette protein MsbA